MRMAGRVEEEAPGIGFEPPAEWRVPCQWLASFSKGGVCEWSAGAGRLRVRHPGGFLLLDAPLGSLDEARERVLHEMEAYRVCANSELRQDSSPALTEAACERDAMARWLGWLMPYVCARLRRALGLGADEAVAPLLCEHAARVRVSATHLDVFFSLPELPIEIRLAGIDRDPGWVPAAGRYIAFHYE